MAHERTAEQTPQTLVGISFPDLFRAQEFLTVAARLGSQGSLRLRDAVFVAKDASGHTVVKETTDLQAGSTAVSGAMWAGLFGLLLGGPIGLAAGAAIGAGGGVIAAKVVDIGITDEWVSWFREAIRPGRTVLAVLAEQVDMQVLTDELGRFPQAELLYANVDAGWLERMYEAVGQATPPPEPSDPAEPSKPS